MNWKALYSLDRSPRLQAILRDTERRRAFMFRWLNILLAAVSGGMTVVNLLTGETLLMYVTLSFALLCAVNVLLQWRRPGWMPALFPIFAVEALALLAFFLISGIPDGFSALWVCLIPAFSLPIFGRRWGGIFSAVAFAMIAFFFWTPWGGSLLRYAYGSTFALRFPFFYLASFVLALFTESIQVETQRELERSEHKYRHLSRHDPLTDLLNRFGFNAALDAAFAAPSDRAVSFLILDIDDFKQVNDTYGHAAGDQVLKMVAAALRETFPTGSICRWGGEEFTVFLDGCAHPREGAERLRAAVEATRVADREQTVSVTVSVGVCVAPDMRQVTIARLVRESDRCLYEAKERGKNQVFCASIP